MRSGASIPRIRAAARGHVEVGVVETNVLGRCAASTCRRRGVSRLAYCRVARLTARARAWFIQERTTPSALKVVMLIASDPRPELDNIVAHWSSAGYGFGGVEHAALMELRPPAPACRGIFVCKTTSAAGVLGTECIALLA